MLYILAAALLGLWFFGLITTYTLGGFVYVVLAVAIAISLLKFIGGRRAT